MQLETGLTALHATIDCDELLFWGKVTGITNDYFIAIGYTYRGMFEFPVKSFYWALGNNFQF